MKVSDFVINFLAEKKIEHMFFLPGGGCMHLVDSLRRDERIEGISLLHEQAVAIAAEIYASTSEKVGAALVTTGPGGTNTITGVLSAYLDSVPIVFISGQVKTSDLKSQYGVRSLGTQEADIVSIVSSITKYAVMIDDKNTIKYHMEKAWEEAISGRKGPVWIDIPLDIQGAYIDEKQLVGYVSKKKEDTECDVNFDDIVELINSSSRPVLMTGNGLLYCREKFNTVKSLLNIPIIPSWKFADLVPNDDPLYIGRCGNLGDRPANFAMQSADLIISLGCRLDFSITGYDRSQWARNAKKVVVEIDQHELDKLGDSIDCPICCNVELFLDGILKRKERLVDNNWLPWKERITYWKRKYPVIQTKFFDDSNGMSMYAVVDCVSKKIDQDVVIVPSSAGTVAEIVFQAIELKKGQILRTNNGLGAMGNEVPGSIGAYYASKKKIINFAGDGGIQLNIQDLATIAGRKLPIKIIVMCNSGYVSIRNMQNNHFEGNYSACNEDSGLYLPDMKKLADAYGIYVEEVSRVRDLEEIICKIIDYEGPAICVAYVSPDSLVEPRAASRVLDDGKILTSSLENQFPFLPDDEILDNLSFEKKGEGYCDV